MPKAKPRRRPMTGTYGTGGKPSPTLVYSASGAGMPGDLAPPEGVMASGQAVGESYVESPQPAAKRSVADYSNELLAAKARALEKRARPSRSDDNDTDNES